MKLVVGVSWLGSLVVAFFLGHYFYPQGLDSSTPNLIASKDIPAAQTDVSSKPSGNKPLTPVNSSTAEISESANKSTKEIVQLAQELSGSKLNTNFAGIAQTYQYIEGMTEDELLEALYLCLNDPSGAENNMALTMFLTRYAEKNPIAAVNFTLLNINNKDQKRSAFMVALNTWSEQNPQDAYDWYKTNKADIGDVGRWSVLSLFSGLAKENLNNAINQLADLPSQRDELSMAIRGMARTLSEESEYQLLMTNIQKMDDKRLTDVAFAAWGQKQPEDAAAWIEALEDKKRSDQLARRLLVSWLGDEPDQATDWYMNYPSDSSRQDKISTVASVMSYSSPEKALSWLNQQTNLESAEPYKRLLSQTANNDPEFARENLYLLKDKKDQVSISHSIYLSLQRISQDKADIFLAESAVKNELLERITKAESYKSKAKSK